ncbi:MAG: YitT family protein, partial [Deltaproteobacteria bacterium]
MPPIARKLPYTVFWNCCLIVVGALIQAIGFKALGQTQGLVPGGLFGTATLIYYKTEVLNTGLIYMLLNIPMFILGYIYLSKRFLAYSSLAMLSLSLFFMLIDFQIDIHNQLYAAVAFGV